MTRSENSGSIEHDGVVVRSEKSSVAVKITSVSACSGCHADGFCSIADTKDKIIDISGRFNLVPGEKVTVLMKKSMGYSAVILAYVIPLFLVIGLLTILSSLSFSELITGFGSLAVLVPYYLILWLIRKRINTNFKFTIK